MSSSVGTFVKAHLDRVRDFYDRAPIESTSFGRRYRKLLAAYYRFVIPPDASVLEVGCGSGELLSYLPNRDVTGIDLSGAQISRAKTRVPHGVFVAAAAETLSTTPPLNRTFDYIVLSDVTGLSADVQQMLEVLHSFGGPDTRLVLNFYNTLWYPILHLATLAGLKSPQPTTNWLSSLDMKNLLDLAGWEVIGQEGRVLLPFRLFGIGNLINRFLAPLLPFLCLVIFQVARRRTVENLPAQRVSVIVPARNEAGNIESAVQRTPVMGAGTEIIFIEGHSKDNTWEEIERVRAKYPEIDIKTMRQSGIGKGNAVREAFAVASGDILMILDADLTVPPEDLPKFYDALVYRRAEFANGVRLVYPMDEKAMRFLNMCANKLFSLAFTWIMGQSVKDTLCGTKVLFRRDYLRIAANRRQFGDFDPFGDFDLLFGARKLNLKIIDIPIRYRERTYGQTNINRWSHGWLLARMVAFSLLRLKMIKV
jgi:SAM-dependent methyltransferase